MIKDLLDPIKELYDDVRRKALMRLEYEGLHKSEAITTPGARFHNDPAGFAMNRYAYYVCFKCKKVLYNIKSYVKWMLVRSWTLIYGCPFTQAYFGGEARCDAEAGQGDDYDPSELICGACSDVSRAQVGRLLYFGHFGKMHLFSLSPSVRWEDWSHSYGNPHTFAQRLNIGEAASLPQWQP